MRAAPTSLLCALALIAAGCAGTVKDTSRTFHTAVVDAGHGGHDSGALGRRGTREEQVNLDTARRLAAALERDGFQVIETRADDRFVTLDRRTTISNRQSNAIFVSVHYNWSRSRSPRGTEVYYTHPYARDLAMNISRELRGLLPNRGVMRARFYVLRKNQYPAVLVECGFLSNRTDEALARDPAFRQQMAGRIARGIFRQRHGG